MAQELDMDNSFTEEDVYGDSVLSVKCKTCGHYASYAEGVGKFLCECNDYGER